MFERYRNWAIATGMGVAVVAGGSGPVTFTKDVLPILQENCQTCHRAAGTTLAGMIAPMSLMTYEEARPWAKAIAKAVETRVMPPWHASAATHGQFENERTLTDAEVATVLSWVEQGAKRGNPSDAPPALDFNTAEWAMGTPDIVVEFEEPFFVEDSVEDLYHNVTVKIPEDQLPEDRWIAGIEFKPGSEVVHHIMGYMSVEGEEADTTRGLIGGSAPGADQGIWPAGYGMLLRKGSSISFGMHYHKEPGPGTGAYDSSRIGLKLHPKDQPVERVVDFWNISYSNFEIPPYAKRWRTGASHIFEEDTHVLGYLPHTHLRGIYAKYTAYYPDGSTEVLLEVPQYDFNWQTQYRYKTPKEIPAGTRIETEMVFDNSEENSLRGGFNPAQRVIFGGPTTDEMDLAWIHTAPAKAMTVGAVDATAESGD